MERTDERARTARRELLADRMRKRDLERPDSDVHSIVGGRGEEDE